MPLAVSALLLKILKITVIVVIGIVLLVAGFLWWASGGDDSDETWIEGAVETFPGGDASTPAPETLTVLCWNMAYGRGAKDDIGDRRDRAFVVATLEGIAAAIRASGADVVALQEVDFAADRTGGIDEVAFLMERLGWRYAARVTTWKNRYVAFPYWPPSQHIGAIHSGQAVLARLPLVRNARYRYPQPEAFAFWYNAFYLHRATQIVDVRVGDRTLTLLNTHLEAFDQANRELQARTLVDLWQREQRPELLVLGDFNAPPSEAGRKTGFVDEPEMDFSEDRTIDTIRAGTGLPEVVALARKGGVDEGATFTFPWEAPTRQLDHVFFADGLALVEGGVWRPGGALSDHLPIRAVFRLVAPTP